MEVSRFFFQGNRGRKTRESYNRKIAFVVFCYFWCHPTKYSRVPKGNRTNQTTQKSLDIFSKPVLNWSYFYSLFILSVLGPEGLPILSLSMSVGELWHPFCSPPSSLRSLPGCQVRCTYFCYLTKHSIIIPYFALNLTRQSPSSFAGFVCINEQTPTKRIWDGSSEDFNPLFIHRTKITQQQCAWDDCCAG